MRPDKEATNCGVSLRRYAPTLRISDKNFAVEIMKDASEDARAVIVKGFPLNLRHESEVTVREKGKANYCKCRVKGQTFIFDGSAMRPTRGNKLRAFQNKSALGKI
jgi:hypothetical protein